MAKKYSKYNSNYILSKPHKRTDKGLISLRDWTTIGGIERLDKGKVPLYGNSNFLFTNRNVSANPTRHIVSKFVGTFTYDDVKDAKPSNNLTELNLYTNDIRDFAYYGSAVELVHSTIQNILRTFPARISLMDERIINVCNFYKNNDGDTYTINDIVNMDLSGEDVFKLKALVDNLQVIKLLDNPFEIDIHHEDIKLGEYSIPYRYLTYYYKNFNVSVDGVNYTPITAYEVKLFYNMLDVEYDRARFNCVFNYCKVAEIIIKSGTDTYQIDGYLFDGKIKWGFEGLQLFISPNENIIENYFNNLKGLEKVLLRRDTKPLYYSRFKTPVINNDVMMVVERGYQFPQKDGFIEINSPSFTTYVNQLFDIANVWDSIYTDNLYQRMTHEAIKNYDWTFTKDYENGDEEEFINGGLRIEKLLRIYGRLFDDIKHHIDGIKYTNINTYDGYNNMPTAQITDNLEESGWNIVTTIPVLDVKDDITQEIISKEFNNQTITNDFIQKYNDKIKWFGNSNSNFIDFTQVNLNFMKKLLLNSNYIFRSKGTKKSIEMMFGLFGFGDEDFSVNEVFYKVKPKLFDEELNDTFENLMYSFEDFVTEMSIDDALPMTVKQFLNNGQKHEFLIPFLNSKSNVDTNLYFQSNGGWGKFSTDKNVYDYTETVSYLRIKYDINELFDVAPIKAKNGDIYYVSNVSEYSKLFSTTEQIKSRYFILKNSNLIYCAQGWKNYNPEEDREYKTQIEYMDKIVVTNLGNNPHVGFGRYDCGNYYIENMTQPFKYPSEKYTTSYGDDEFYKNESSRNSDIEKFKFEIDESYTDVEDKVFNIKKEEQKDVYYLNSKIVRIENKINNVYYKEYFKEVILPYIMQVVPATTILILKDF